MALHHALWASLGDPAKNRHLRRVEDPLMGRSRTFDASASHRGHGAVESTSEERGPSVFRCQEANREGGRNSLILRRQMASGGLNGAAVVLALELQLLVANEPFPDLPGAGPVKVQELPEAKTLALGVELA